MKKSKTAEELYESTDEILVGDSKKKNNNNQEPPDFWSDDFGAVNESDIERIIKIPPVDDMAAVLAGSNLASNEDRISLLKVIKRLQKFDLQSRLEWIRICIGSTIGMMAFGKTLQLQSKIELIAPAVIREQLNMRNSKRKEESIRGSDFREEVKSKEPKRDDGV